MTYEIQSAAPSTGAVTWVTDYTVYLPGTSTLDPNETISRLVLQATCGWRVARAIPVADDAGTAAQIPASNVPGDAGKFSVFIGPRNPVA